MSDSLQPHGLKPPWFLCPWDCPRKNTGVGCHFLLQVCDNRLCTNLKWHFLKVFRDMSYKIMQTVQLHICFLSAEKRGWKICMTAPLPEQDWGSGDWYVPVSLHEDSAWVHRSLIVSVVTLEHVFICGRVWGSTYQWILSVYSHVLCKSLCV